MAGVQVDLDQRLASEVDLPGVARCPAGCGTLIECGAPEWHTGIPELDRTPPKAFVPESLPRAAALHFATHRFRCPGCAANFCGECMAVPYHAGLTCAQHAAPKCALCGERARLGGPPEPVPIRRMRATLAEHGGDCGTILEKAELEARYARLVAACAECAELSLAACAERLPCGHFCAGVADEPVGEHLGCCRAGCAHRLLRRPEAPRRAGRLAASAASAAAAEQGECYACHEPLHTEATIALRCAHLIHQRCAAAAIVASFPGPAISFGHLDCPGCRAAGPAGAVGLEHPSLREPLKRPLALRQEVLRCAKRQLREHASDDEREAVRPGGRYDGRVLAYALETFHFFECGRCGAPFCGGRRECARPGGAHAEPAGAAREGAGGEPGEPGASDDDERLCASCASAGKRCARGHGAEHLAWKCRYCCAEASWFCWGTTHMCDGCHADAQAGTLAWSAGAGCAQASACPLRVAHGPHGAEFALGCAACR